MYGLGFARSIPNSTAVIGIATSDVEIRRRLPTVRERRPESESDPRIDLVCACTLPNPFGFLLPRVRPPCPYRPSSLSSTTGNEFGDLTFLDVSTPYTEPAPCRRHHLVDTVLVPGSDTDCIDIDTLTLGEAFIPPQPTSTPSAPKHGLIFPTPLPLPRGV